MPRKYTPEQFEAAFVGRIDATTGPDACWVWTGRRNVHGYGCMDVQHRSVLAHRVAFERAYGPIPAGMLVCHRCDNRACCNPAHLFLGTQTDNMHDMKTKGRRRGPSGAAHSAKMKMVAARGDENGARLYPERLLRGEAAARSRLHASDIPVIRDLYSVDGLSLAEIARRFGVSNVAIRYVVTRQSWRHIE